MKPSRSADLVLRLSGLLILSGLPQCFGAETNKPTTNQWSLTIGTNTFDCAKEREKALKGDAQAQYNTALCYSFRENDRTEMVTWYRKAAEQGHHEAQYYLARCYAEGTGVPKDSAQAVKWYRKAADGGPADVQFWVATRFWNEGIDGGIPVDQQECLKWLRKSAEQGHAPAQSMLGRICLKGELLPKDVAEAAKWLRKAEEQGDSSDPISRELDYCLLAADYAQGWGIPKDEREALKWYRKAADLPGAFVAQWHLGVMYEEGKGTAKDPAKAAKWYRKAADQGFGDAQVALGNLYCEGRGVPLDGREAIKWYQKAADAGYVDALVGIATVWAFGKGVPKSTYEAVKWYKQAAERGDTISKFNLGLLYFRGEGVPLDYVEAYKWFNLAAANGYEKAVELRNSLASQMTREQTAEAQRRASEFLARKDAPNQSGGGRNSTPADPSLATPKASGSGFFITEDGYLLTNFHVIEGAARIVVKTKFGSFPAALVRADTINDIAVLRVSGAFRPLPIAPSRTVKLGESVITVGFPNPALQGVEPKLTDGKISSLAGIQDDARQFQISVAVQPGNSGGALVSSVGNAVGIVTARLSDKAALESSGALPQNVNYAIKSSYVLSLLESLPDVASKLKEPWPAKERRFEDVAKEAQDAAVLVLVY